VGSAAPHGSHTNIMVALISLAREMQIARDSRLHSHGRWYNPVSEFMDFSLDSSSWNIVADCRLRFVRMDARRHWVVGTIVLEVDIIVPLPSIDVGSGDSKVDW